MEVASQRLSRLFALLARQFGRTEWWPARSQFEICLGAILTQNTSWHNVTSALQNLIAYGVQSAQDILELEQARLEELIRPSGYYRQKAKKLIAFSRWLISHDENYLEISRKPTPELRRQLLGIWGIGPETADAILCYALGKPVFVVDAYFKRLMIRHGLVRDSARYEELQEIAHQALDHDPVTMNQAHAWIVETGKRWCSKSNPDCQHCPLGDLLPGAR